MFIKVKKELQPGKKIIITLLTFMLTLIYFIGCSDDINNFNLNNGEMNKNFSEGRTLLWSRDLLTIKANGERIVNDGEKYIKSDEAIIYILITYDGQTNADTSTYVSQVSILGDNQTLFIETGEQYINRHHSLTFNISNFNQIRFYIALWCDGWEEYCSSASLQISNLKIYQIN